MSWFACKHPARSLFVDRDSSVMKRDEDFTDVTFHLVCFKCGEKVDIGYSMLTKTVPEFLNIGMAKRERESK